MKNILKGGLGMGAAIPIIIESLTGGPVDWAQLVSGLCLFVYTLLARKKEEPTV